MQQGQLAVQVELASGVGGVLHRGVSVGVESPSASLVKKGN